MDTESRAERAFEDFVESFSAHIFGDRYALDVATLRSLARTEEYRDVVLVPAKYPIAYRLLWQVPSEQLAEVIGAPPVVEAHGGCAKHEVSDGKINSWTISLKSLRQGNRMFIPSDVAKQSPMASDGYAVLLSAVTSTPNGRRRKFYLNPDETYACLGRDGAWAAAEREVVSVGSVGRVLLSYARQADGERRSWDDLMNSLVSSARSDPGYADRVSACSRRRRP